MKRDNLRYCWGQDKPADNGSLWKPRVVWLRSEVLGETSQAWSWPVAYILNRYRGIVVELALFTNRLLIFGSLISISLCDRFNFGSLHCIFWFNISVFLLFKRYKYIYMYIYILLKICIYILLKIYIYL